MTITSIEQLPLLLTIQDLQTLLRCGRTAAYEATRAEDFPAPISINGRSYRWPAAEVVDYLLGRRVAVTDRVRDRAPVVKDDGDDLPYLVPVPA